MRRIFIYTLLTLGLVGGVASADRDDHRGRGGEHERGERGEHQRGGWYQRGQQQPTYRYQPRGSYRYESPRYSRQARVRVVRRPIYVQRPVIRYHYYNYYQRPAIIAENYSPMAGYSWIPGQWQWDGYEWIWQPGHYEPDPSYDYQYNDGYNYDAPPPSNYDYYYGN